MPFPIALAGLAGRLAGAGIIRGSLGKLLRKGGSTGLSGPIAPVLRTIPQTMPRLPSTLGGVVRKGGKIAMGGAAWEVGSRVAQRFGGDDEPRRYRRMNTCNMKALKRAVRRINGAAKAYGKVLSATKGTRHSGFTIKPKGKAKCR